MKDNGYTLKTLDIFMTKKDEYDFSVILKNEFGNLSFVSYEAGKDKKRKEFEYLSQADTTHMTIVNNNIVSLDKYDSIVAKRNLFYYFPQIGNGIIQFDASRPSEYHENCLSNGRIAMSYLEEEIETASFTKKVLNIIKANGKYVHRVMEKNIFKKPERSAFAWPDAANQFNGSSGRFLSFGYKILAIAKSQSNTRSQQNTRGQPEGVNPSIATKH
jgi:hypothetical protein